MQPVPSVQALLFSVPGIWGHVTHGYKVLRLGVLGPLNARTLSVRVWSETRYDSGAWEDVGISLLGRHP